MSVSASSLAKTPEPPYYAVIFSSQRTEGDRGYDQMAERMFEIASRQPGFLGVESARDTDGFGITVSYWESEEAVIAWKPSWKISANYGGGFCFRPRRAKGQLEKRRRSRCLFRQSNHPALSGGFAASQKIHCCHKTRFAGLMVNPSLTRER